MEDELRVLIESLNEVSGSVASLSRGDRDAVIAVGLRLQNLAPDIPTDVEGLADLIMLCLEGLRTVYENLDTFADDLPRIIADGCSEVARMLCSGETECSEPMARTARDLCRATGTEYGCWKLESAAEPCPVFDTLDDIAAQLIQLEPEDTEELARLHDALSSMADAEHVSAAAKSIIPKALPALQDLVSGRAEDPEATMAELGRILEWAMAANDESEPASTAEPQAEAEARPIGVTTTFELPSDADASLLNDFVMECLEYIEGAEASLLTLETDPENVESVGVIFRAFHTIKGTSAFLGMDPISELAHKAESLLSRVRDGEIRCTGGYADLALRSIDVLKELVKQVQEGLAGARMLVPDGYGDLLDVLNDPEAAGVSADSTENGLEAPRLGDILVAEGAAERTVVEEVAESKGERLMGEAMVKADAASLGDVAKALRTQQRLSGAESGVESSVRVRTDRLDGLIDMVGELVIAQSMVSQDGTVVLGGHHELSKKVTHMGKIVRELQHLSMSMRMVPLKPTFQKMARLVRDVARKSGKLVEFVTEGEDTEIDRNMVDVINDPLVHMVRNAVDHGVESPDVRASRGKPRTGTVRLMAYHSGGNVVVEMRDDGNGIDRGRIVEKAISKGLIDSDKGMSDGEVFNLIFEPGFSTAEKVTDISGRGVGLDVVKRNVEALRGRIEILAEPGKGSTFLMRLPLTLAVTDGMLVRVGDERFIIPTINIHKSFRPERDSLSTVTGRGELVMLRGELMPIFRLHKLFHIEGAVEDVADGLLVMLGDGDRRCALLVDELLGQQHVVAKTLGDGVGNIQGISGGAILGDGRVGLIIDPAAIASLARAAVGELTCEDTISGFAA